jgi:hypothetical protein
MMQIRFHTLSVLVAAVLALTGMGGVAGAAGDSSAHHAPFAAQARSLGLTSAEADRLQARVDREVRHTGGTQVAANEVRYDGGATVLTLPGERIARPLTTDRSSSARPTAHRCPYYYFCWYDGRDYTGSMHLTKTCNVYYKVPQASIASYYNNQTTGTQARFYDWFGDYMQSSRPAPASEPAPWPDSWEISSILACST